MKRTSAGASFHVTRSHKSFLYLIGIATLFNATITLTGMHAMQTMQNQVAHDCTVCAPDPEVSSPSAPAMTFATETNTGFYQPVVAPLEEARLSPTAGARWHLAIKGVDCGEVDDQTAREISSMLSRMR